MSIQHITPKFLKPDEDSFLTERDSAPTDDHVTSFVFNSNHSLSLKTQKERLPIYNYRDHILFCLENYQTLVLVGETGSGKSTQVPQYLVENGWHTKGIIGITQPRRISALTLGERVANERGEILGDSVGVSVRFISKFTEQTKIKFMTEGILLREILADPLLTQYSVIVVDEAHECSTLTITAISLLKKICKLRKNLKIIIASATVDAELFRDFFNFNHNTGEKSTSVVLTVEGRMFPYDIFYLKEPCPNYVKATVETIFKIHTKQPNGDILAFLTGQEEVLQAMDLLKEYFADSHKDDLLILPMYGTLANVDQLRVFFAPPRGVRKVVIATNIAETSVTIPGIVYVIDCGFVKLNFFMNDSMMNQLSVVPISQAAADQRAGRAGRVRSGKVYRLYTEEDWKKLDQHTASEMHRTDLCSTVLYLKALGIDNIVTFDFITAPPVANLLSAVEILYALDALDIKGNLTIPIGYTLAEMPLSPMMGKMLYISGQMGCSEEIVTIIAMLQVQSIFSKPGTGLGAINARRAKRNFEVAEGDLITLLNVYEVFLENDRSKIFCGENYLIYRNLKRAHEIRTQLISLIQRELNIPLFSCKNDVELICRCITAGFFPYAAYLHHSGVYRSIRGDVELHIHPLSALYTEKRPPRIIFCELQQTTKRFMKDVTVVKDEWLLELAPHYYEKTTVKHH